MGTIDARASWVQRYTPDVVNRGIRAFGIKEVAVHLRVFLNMYKSSIPVVSVGSGFGMIEWVTDPGRRWVCVDPHPCSWPQGYSSWIRMQPFIHPSAPTVHELLKVHPDMEQNCILFLNWCEVDTPFDLESIKLLKPLAIFTIVDKSGKQSGSTEFIHWMNYVHTTEYILSHETRLSNHYQSSISPEPFSIKLYEIDPTNASSSAKVGSML